MSSSSNNRKKERSIQRAYYSSRNIRRKQRDMYYLFSIFPFRRSKKSIRNVREKNRSSACFARCCRRASSLLLLLISFEKMVAHRRHHFLLKTFCFCAIIVTIFPEKAFAIAGKCSACKAVSAELQEALNKENKQRNHIDMRGRLDSKGQRYGK